MMIKDIFFDLDDTILDFKKAERTALAKTLSSMNIPVSDEILSRYSELNISQWKRLERGEITRQEVKVNRYRLLFEEFAIDASPEQVTAVYEDNLCIGHFFINSAQRTIERLYGRYNLYLVSNGSERVQSSRLKSAGISPYFNDIFISEKVGAEKPSVEFFNYCFDRIDNFRRSEALIVGDSLTSDIQGGINAKIKTVWFNPHNNKNASLIIPDYEINDLSQLENIVGLN